MGGGGGSKQTSTSGLADEAKPYYNKLAQSASGELDRTMGDPNSIVAGLSNQQLQGLGAQQGLAQQAVTGTGLYDDRANVQRMLQNAQGAQEYGRQGALGSSRGDRAQAAALADMGYQFQEGRQRKAEGGAQSMQDVGGAFQEHKQKLLDAPYTAQQRFSSLVFPYATKETVQTGGGK